MLKKKSVLITISVALLLCLSLSIVGSAASIFFYETQYTYNKSIPSWLMDLAVYDDLTTIESVISSMIKACTIVPVPGAYKYSKTHEAFAEEVNKLVGIFSLDEQGEDAQKAVYMYVIGLLGEFSDAYMTEASDETIRVQLEAAGIVFPAEKDMTTEHYLFARVVYTVLTRSPNTLTIPKGTTLEAAFIMIIGQLVDVDTSGIEVDLKNADLKTVEQYTTEVAKVALKTRGYNFSEGVSNSEIYRILAVMVIETTGTTVDADNITFSELKIKYLASALGLAYDVKLNPNSLKTAIANGNVPFYILQSIASNYKLTIRSDLSYEDAFMRVAENTNYFTLKNEFYADISEYKVYLAYKTDHAWIYPTALQKTDKSKGQTVSITINGKTAEDVYPNGITLDKTKASQVFTVAVKYQKGTTVSDTVYKITIYQGDVELPANNNNNNNNNETPTQEPNTTTPDNSDSGFLGSIGSLPSKINNVMSLIVPAFTGSEPSGYNYMASLLSLTADANDKDDDGKLGGIGGIDLSVTSENSSSPLTPNFNSSGYYGGGLGGDADDSTTNPADDNPPLANPSLVHINDMEPAPIGYTYITDSNGYVLGLSVTHESKTFAPASPNVQAAQFIKNNIWLFLLLALSLIGIGTAVIWNLEFRRVKR